MFFLAFGLCVICSCMRRRPKFQGGDEPPPVQKPPPPTVLTKSAQQPAQSVLAATVDRLRPRSMKRRSVREASASPARPRASPPAPIVSPSLRPTFKAIVARAMQQQQLSRQLAQSEGAAGAAGAAPHSAAERGRDRDRLLEEAGGESRTAPPHSPTAPTDPAEQVPSRCRAARPGRPHSLTSPLTS